MLGLGGSRGGSFFSDGETRGRATVHACAVQLNLQLRFSDRAAGVGFAWARSGGAPADGGAERSGRLAGPRARAGEDEHARLHPDALCGGNHGRKK